MVHLFDKSPVVHGRLAKEYAERYYEFEDDIATTFERLDTPFLDKRIKPGMLVLDAMMGRGRHAIRYAKRGAIVLGNDLNPHMVALAKKSAQRARAKLTFQNLDACRLNGISKNRFDITYAMFSSVGTIPTSANRQRAIMSMARVTKRGGLVIIHAHNRLDTWYKSGWVGWAVKTTFWPDQGLETGDMVTDYNDLHDMFNHFYTPAELRASFARAGLTVIEERYMDYNGARFLSGPLRKLRADGFIFVGKKR